MLVATDVVGSIVRFSRAPDRDMRAVYLYATVPRRTVERFAGYLENVRECREMQGVVSQRKT